VFRTTLINLRARKLRLLTTSLAVLIGVAFMSGSLVLTDTMGRTFDGLFADIYAGTDAVVRSSETVGGDAFLGASRGRIGADVLEAVAAVDGVEVAEGDIDGYAQIVGGDGEALGSPGAGPPTLGVVWSDHERLNPLTIVEGRGPAAEGEVAIDRSSATAGEIAVGDEITVLTAAGPGSFTVTGITRWGEADSPLGASIVAFTSPEAQRLLAEPGRFDRIVVAAVPGVSQEELRDRLAAVTPAGVEVLTGDAVTAEEQSSMREALSFFGTFMLSFALIALFVGSFIIYNTFSILAAQRSREMALLRAIGASKGQVLGSMLMEALVVGLLASVLGLLAGIGVAGLLKALLAAFGLDVPAGGTVVTTSTVITALVVGVSVTVAAAVVPARKASRIPPVAAMRDTEVEQPTRSKRRTAIGVAVTVAGGLLLSLGLFGDTGNPVAFVGLGAAVVFLGVAVLGPVIVTPVARVLGAPLPRLRGVAGRLARENALRNPKRTAATASALMIGVGLVGFITVFAASATASIDRIIDESFRGDFIVDSGSFGLGGFNPQLARDLQDRPEVGTASAIRFTQTEIEGNGTFLVAVDPATVGRIFDLGAADGDLAALDAGSIAVHDRRAEDEGWAIGDTVTVRFAETGVQEMRIALLFTERDLVGGSFAVGLAAFDANVVPVQDAQIYVTRGDGVDAESARLAVEETVATYPTATVLDQTEFKDANTAQFNQLVALVLAMLALAVLIALMGIANTLALSIFERTRELGLLRAVGMTRSQLRTVVRWESVIIAVFGAALGLVIGLFFGWALFRALADEGFREFRVPVGTLAIVTVLAALAGVVAAILPARRAARLDVLQAIASE
jgi:putative ABC transport system permease protein